MTFYMSLAVIRHLRLDDTDILFLSDRKYRNGYFHYEMNDFSEYAAKLSPFTLKSAFILRDVTKRTDSRMAELCHGEDYVVYLPHLANSAYQLLITNGHCRGFNFMEEGLANYVERNYVSHFPYKCTFPGSKTCFRLGLDVFNFFHGRICLKHNVFGRFKDYPFEPTYFYLDSPYCRREGNVVPLSLPRHEVNARIPGNAALLVLSPLLRNNLATREGYRRCCARLIGKVAESTNLLYVRTHPHTEPQELPMLREIAEANRLEMVETDRDEPMEQILPSLEGNMVAGIESSVLFYAKLLNSRLRVVSAYRYLMSHDRLYKERCCIKDIQDIFSKGMEVL